MATKVKTTVFEQAKGGMSLARSISRYGVELDRLGQGFLHPLRLRPQSRPLVCFHEAFLSDSGAIIQAYPSPVFALRWPLSLGGTIVRTPMGVSLHCIRLVGSN